MVSIANKTSLNLCGLFFICQGMRDRMERFAVLPFGIGCTSQSSVAVGTSDHDRHHHQLRKPKSAAHQHVTNDRKAQGAKMKTSTSTTLHFRALRKTRISSRMWRLIRSIKSFSQIFVYKEEMEEEEEREMEIGLPTDVKHVTHIGFDGTTTTTANPLKGTSWENNFNAPEKAEILSNFPSISLKQFEFAMAAQTNHQPSPPPLPAAPPC